jgi:hypothetical protein
MLTIEKPTEVVDRRPWVIPKLEPVGSIAEVLHGGGGKLSLTGGDPGDSRKPRGHEGR